MSSESKTCFLTGFPAFTACKMLEKLIHEGFNVYLLVQEKFVQDAEQTLIRLKKENPNVKLLVGDILNIDLGLSGEEVKKIAKEVNIIHHMASIYYLGVSSQTIRKVNVEGTRNILELACEMKNLKRLNFYSTAFVSGNRTGVILEEELDMGQTHFNEYERTKFIAEKLIMEEFKNLPISVLRPSIIVGDSRTGEIDKLDGPYLLINAILNMPFDIHIPLPGGGNYPLNMVPVNYVIDVAYWISLHKDGAGKIFHLTDPNPLPAHKVFEFVSDIAHKKRPKGSIPSFATSLLTKLPFIEKHTHRFSSFFQHFNRLTIYNTSNTLKILSGSNITCPPFDSYVDVLIRFLKQKMIQDKLLKRKSSETTFSEEDDLSFY